MTARNGIRTENKMKRLAAAVGVALAAMLAAASLSPARADAAGTSDGNLVIDVPTTVPCALMADGTVVSPSDWKITTSGDAYISSASASGFPANVEWSARTTDLAATQAGAVQVAGTGDAATVSGPSDPAAATLAGTARFEWSFSKLDAGKNADVIGKAAGGTAVLGSVTFTFAKPASAFAIYSADDNSLTFYKRANVPAAGQMFEGKTVTEVYEGMEKASYTAADGAPWAGHAAELASVTVADEGIAPVSTAYWFNGASKLRSVDIAALDTSQTTCMDGMFQGCSSLESLDLSAMSTRRVASMTAFLGGCDSLAELSIGSEFAWVGDDCYPPTGNWKQGSTGTDYSESQIPSNKTDKYNRVKTAFAVYSADDQSLTFYKRFELPANGAQFLGKTATRVYTGFETKTYASAGSVPWSAYASSINAVTMADEGVAPVSTSCWFYSFTKVKSFDLSKLDTRKVTNMNSMFFNCGALTALDLSSFDTLNATNMGYMFYGCKALTTLDVSSFDTQNATNMSMMFDGCSALTTLDVSSFDTRNVISMYGMFDNCSALTSLDLSMFDTSSVVNMNSMFFSCGALTTLDVSSFNTENVTNMGIMFEGCSALTSLDVSSFHTGNVKDMNRMFS
ncbi:BspA family leucine-rich repeat surface protein, partial [Ellagibacter isourolithinifaciens]|uniref:BspA family leucine-rich repeat surface protein n=1 Tax=Ellagibacter isourolithinifaciens TaxID=2137581 RepID=UPI003A8DEA1E